MDFSSVVSVFPFRESEDGSSASCTFGLRRPGLRFAASSVVVAEEDDGAGGNPAGGVDMLEPSLLLTSSMVSGGFQSGQFLASFESSGTSTISLSLRLTEINQV